MIQVHTYTLPCSDPDVPARIAEKVESMVRHRSDLLGASGELSGGLLTLRVRVTGSDQWRCQESARQVARFFLARHGLGKGEAPLVASIETEKNRRALTLQEGRTVRDYPTRPERLRRRVQLRESGQPQSA